MEEHQATLERICADVKSFHDRKAPFRVYHGSTNSTRAIHLDPSKVVNISDLSHIISIDTTAGTVVVEPSVPMDALVAFTSKHALVPPVVPEFPGITVGGAFSGTAAESSSFRHGFFDRCAAWIEVVLADGDVVRASAEERSDLFYGAVGAMGTLGILTLFELKLMPATPLLEVTYIQTGDPAETLSCIETQCHDACLDYVDGIILNRIHGVVVTARMHHPTPTPTLLKTQTFLRPTDPWFFHHASDQATHTTQLVPLADYLFRYDRGAFWLGAHTLRMLGIPSTRRTRALADPLLRTRKLYQALHHSGLAQRSLIQDLVVPGECARALLDWLELHLPIAPLWLCPVRGGARAAMHAARVPVDAPCAAAGGQSEMLVNVGVWGKGYSDGNAAGFVRANRALEAVVARLGGKKWLYARTFYTEEEFWAVYDRPAYDELRRRWRAETLPSVYDKVKFDEGSLDRPIRRVRGLLCAVLGKEWLLR